MDVPLLIKQRLNELALDQKDLAAAIQVTESYISQLLARKKAPPAPGRTDLYDKMGAFLKLPPGELSKLAELQRHVELKKKIEDTPEPLFPACREMLLRKCPTGDEVRQIFSKDPFGELERLALQTLLEVAQTAARESNMPGSKAFLRCDVFHSPVEACVSFFDPLIDHWSIDVKTFRMEIGLKGAQVKRFEFTERPGNPPAGAGLEAFLKDKSLSGDATEDEIGFLKSLRFSGRHPTALYYYRELQNLRDPLHFR